MDSSQNSSKDLTSIMSQVENLQRQLASQAAELKETRDREEMARKQVEQLNEVNSKLTEAKREAMKQDFNNVVQGWVRSLDEKQVPDSLKEEFLSGVEKFVDKGNESGIWKVMFCFFKLFLHKPTITNTHPCRWFAARRACTRTR